MTPFILFKVVRPGNSCNNMVGRYPAVVGSYDLLRKWIDDEGCDRDDCAAGCD